MRTPKATGAGPSSDGGFDPASLAQAEFVLLSEPGLALALAYSPGRTPLVVAAARHAHAEELLWCAQELGLPLVECTVDSQAAGLRPGQEIPEALYRPVAQCLALLARSPQAPAPVKLVRPRGRVPSRLKNRLRKRADEIADLLRVSLLRLEVGQAVPLEALQPSLAALQRRLELELGLVLSTFEVEARAELRPLEYRLLIHEVEAARGELEPAGRLSGLLGAVVEQVHQRAWQLLGYRETEVLLENLRRTHRRLVDEVYPAHLGVAALRRILRNLLREAIPIRDLPAILEAILDNLSHAQDPDLLTEYVRSAFAHYLCRKYADDQGTLWVLLLDPRAEKAVMRGVRQGSSALWLEVDLEVSLKILSGVASGLEKAAGQGVPVVALCGPGTRRFLRRVLEPSFPNLPVLAYSEVAPMTEVRTLGLVSV
ncbi:MAG TPA: FHIPEP family type III secretion protein [Candidatus Nitrosotenuis sp.]|jgi:flagellar biosynthesis component FlhA|nr:FHIPEP family type III secretion protein [Candidatus Nitrosotenuis sp.]